MFYDPVKKAGLPGGFSNKFEKQRVMPAQQTSRMQPFTDIAQYPII
jgi:hypothetical protein